MRAVDNGRLTWADNVRGAAVLLVVLHHVVRQMVEVSPPSWTRAAELWSTVDDLITPARIPLFFFISGMLMAKAIESSSWTNRKSWVTPGYLYLLWSGLLTLRLLVPGNKSDFNFISNLVGNIVLVGSGYWYLFALPVYFFYCFLTRRLPPVFAIIPLILGLAFRAPITSWTQDLGHDFMDSESLIGSVVANGLFFWVGVKFGRPASSWLTSRRSWIAVSCVLLYILVQASALRLDLAEAFFPVASVLGISAGIMACARLPKKWAIARALSYIGHRTLPVYVLQFFFISILSLLWSRWSFILTAPQFDLFGIAYPILTTAAMTILSLSIYWLAVRSNLTAWLFVPPMFVRGAGSISPGQR